MQDVVIIGGGAAGLTAALYLGRFRRQVLVLDGGQPANRFSHAAHGFFTRDGVSPLELLRLGREDLRRYETTKIMSAEAIAVHPTAGHFEVQLADGSTYETRKVLLATGMRDQLPAIPGLDRFWGTSVFHCPYCDGWELRDQPVGLIASGPDAFHMAKLLRALTADLMIFTNGPAEFDEADRARLLRHAVRIVETPIERVDGSGAQLDRLILNDGNQVVRQAVFVRPITTQHSGIAAHLGCATQESGLLVVDSAGRTSVTGVYAAGDTAQLPRQITLAVTQGAMAAVGINTDLISEDFD